MSHLRPSRSGVVEGVRRGGVGAGLHGKRAGAISTPLTDFSKFSEASFIEVEEV